jgi:putative hydrolase
VPDGLRVLTGVETKILDANGALDLPPGELGVDRIVIADHQFPGPDGPWHPEQAKAHLAAGLSVSDAMDLLVAGLIGAMGAVDRGQLAHCFSILPKLGLSEDDLSEAQLDAWATVAARTGTFIEVNEKWGCPGPRALRATVSAGAILVAGSDAHHARDVGRYDRVVQLFEQALP